MPAFRAIPVRHGAALVAGPAAALLVGALLPSSMDASARAVAAMAAWMALWWLTEAIPLSATALLPAVFLPAAGVLSLRQAAAPYADPLLLLFFGGFVLGEAMQKWGLHRRIALVTVLLVGSRPRALVAGVMLATAVMSMWVSNTATAVMMAPIALSLAGLARQQAGARDAALEEELARYEVALLLGVAYAASIGGMGTIIGTPPNGVLVAIMAQEPDRLGPPIPFAAWLLVIGLPAVALLLPVAWAYLVYVGSPVRLPAFSGGRSAIRGMLRELGPVTRAEWIVMGVFFSAVAAWLFQRPIVAMLGVPTLAAGAAADKVIAVAAALLLFVIPVRVERRRLVFAMDWESARNLPWGVLILFGGGLSLASAMTATGLDQQIGHLIAHVGHWPAWALIGALILLTIFASELASNTALTTALLPVLAASAVVLGVHPLTLMLPATLAASCGFMLPAGTPPNAIVFATGRLPLRTMLRAGLRMDLLCALLLTLVFALFGRTLTAAVGDARPPDAAPVAETAR